MSFNQLIERLARFNSSQLPGDHAHELVLPINRPLSSTLQDISDYRLSAVAIYLYESNNRLMSVLIERPEYDGYHSKQIAFPGGKKEESDESLIKTALREGNEEIGVLEEQCTLITGLSQVHIPVSKFSIHPYLFALNQKPNFYPDPREVARIIELDLNHFADASDVSRRTLDLGNGLRRKDVPGFLLEDQSFVWGATAMILSELRLLLKS